MMAFPSNWPARFGLGHFVAERRIILNPMSIVVDDGMVEPWAEVTVAAHKVPPETGGDTLPPYPQRSGVVTIASGDGGGARSSACASNG
jgi:hypothetical protein